MREEKETQRQRKPTVPAFSKNPGSRASTPVSLKSFARLARHLFCWWAGLEKQSATNNPSDETRLIGEYVGRVIIKSAHVQVQYSKISLRPGGVLDTVIRRQPDSPQTIRPNQLPRLYPMPLPPQEVRAWHRNIPTIPKFPNTAVAVAGHGRVPRETGRAQKQ